MGRRKSKKSAGKRVGRVLTHLREGQGLSRAELARRVGTSTSQISAVESGERSPTLDSLERLARALKVPLADLFPEEAIEASSRSEKIWFEIADMLRDRDVEYLRAVKELLKGFDRAVDLAVEGDG